MCNCSLYQCLLQVLHNYHYITALPLTYFTLHTTKLSNWTVNMNSFSLRNSRMKCVLSNVVVFTYSYLKSVLLSLCKIVLYTVTIPIKIFLFNRMSSYKWNNLWKHKTVIFYVVTSCSAVGVTNTMKKLWKWMVTTYNIVQCYNPKDYNQHLHHQSFPELMNMIFFIACRCM